MCLPVDGDGGCMASGRDYECEEVFEAGRQAAGAERR